MTVPDNLHQDCGCNYTCQQRQSICPRLAYNRQDGAPDADTEALIAAVYRVLSEGSWGNGGWICSRDARIALGDAWNVLPSGIRLRASQ